VGAVIARFARTDLETASFRLGKLDDLSLVRRRSDIGYIGYQLTIHGYDVLAMRALARKGIVEAISTTQVGVGKDADVYVGITPTGEKVAVKFNRVGGAGLPRGGPPTTPTSLQTSTTRAGSTFRGSLPRGNTTRWFCSARLRGFRNR